MDLGMTDFYCFLTAERQIIQIKFRPFTHLKCIEMSPFVAVQ